MKSLLKMIIAPVMEALNLLSTTATISAALATIKPRPCLDQSLFLTKSKMILCWGIYIIGARSKLKMATTLLAAWPKFAMIFPPNIWK